MSSTSHPSVVSPDPDRLTIESVLFGGSFGTVYRGLLHASPPATAARPVAVKVFDCHYPTLSQDLLREITTTSFLAASQRAIDRIALQEEAARVVRQVVRCRLNAEAERTSGTPPPPPSNPSSSGDQKDATTDDDISGGARWTTVTGLLTARVFSPIHHVFVEPMRERNGATSGGTGALVGGRVFMVVELYTGFNTLLEAVTELSRTRDAMGAQVEALLQSGPPGPVMQRAVSDLQKAQDYEMDEMLVGLASSILFSTAVMHELGFIHRDIKLENTFVRCWKGSAKGKGDGLDVVAPYLVEATLEGQRHREQQLKRERQRQAQHIRGVSSEGGGIGVTSSFTHPSSTTASASSSILAHLHFTSTMIDFGSSKHRSMTDSASWARFLYHPTLRAPEVILGSAGITEVAETWAIAAMMFALVSEDGDDLFQGATDDEVEAGVEELLKSTVESGSSFTDGGGVNNNSLTAMSVDLSFTSGGIVVGDITRPDDIQCLFVLNEQIREFGLDSVLYDDDMYDVCDARRRQYFQKLWERSRALDAKRASGERGASGDSAPASPMLSQAASPSMPSPGSSTSGTGSGPDKLLQLAHRYPRFVSLLNRMLVVSPLKRPRPAELFDQLGPSLFAGNRYGGDSILRVWKWLTVDRDDDIAAPPPATAAAAAKTSAATSPPPTFVLSKEEGVFPGTLLGAIVAHAGDPDRVWSYLGPVSSPQCQVLERLVRSLAANRMTATAAEEEEVKTSAEGGGKPPVCQRSFHLGKDMEWRPFPLLGGTELSALDLALGFDVWRCYTWIRGGGGGSSEQNTTSRGGQQSTTTTAATATDNTNASSMFQKCLELVTCAYMVHKLIDDRHVDGYTDAATGANPVDALVAAAFLAAAPDGESSHSGGAAFSLPVNSFTARSCKLVELDVVASGAWEKLWSFNTPLVRYLRCAGVVGVVRPVDDDGLFIHPPGYTQQERAADYLRSLLAGS